MILSKTCRYGLRATIFLATKKKGDYVTIREISDELNISFHFLTKVLQRLTKADLLESYRGPNGGVKLARQPSEITFMDVVISIDGGSIIDECALGLPGCGSLKPCPVHEKWSGLKSNMLTMMRTITMADIAYGANKQNLKSDFLEYDLK